MGFSLFWGALLRLSLLVSSGSFSVRALELQHDGSCVFTPKDGAGTSGSSAATTIDLRPLAQKGVVTVAGVQSPADTYDYFMQICAPLGADVGCGSGAAGCQKVSNLELYTLIGRADTLVATGIPASSSKEEEEGSSSASEMGGGVSLYYGEGAGGRSFQLDIHCELSAGAAGGSYDTPVFVSQENDAKTGSFKYTFRWSSIWACADAEHQGVSPGSIILMCLGGLIVLYLVGGILVNRFARHKRGVEVIPNVEFWHALPSLVLDGCRFLVAKLCCCCGNRGYEFQQLPSGRS